MALAGVDDALAAALGALDAGLADDGGAAGAAEAQQAADGAGGAAFGAPLLKVRPNRRVQYLESLAEAESRPGPGEAAKVEPSKWAMTFREM
eukprot:SAG22_NODE_1866_length_3405_cov_5.505594_4_plen_92_part_00